LANVVISNGIVIFSLDHSFPRQIFPNSTVQFEKFRGSPRQIFHI